eukprot:jgi/Psemu1/53488/gm1.53488_g
MSDQRADEKVNHWLQWLASLQSNPGGQKKYSAEVARMKKVNPWLRLFSQPAAK